MSLLNTIKRQILIGLPQDRVIEAKINDRLEEELEEEINRLSNVELIEFLEAALAEGEKL